jgi:hypothetical protein
MAGAGGTPIVTGGMTKGRHGEPDFQTYMLVSVHHTFKCGPDLLSARAENHKAMQRWS